MPRETLICADVHQCLDELKELLDKAKYDPASMRLIFVGDLLSRGPFPAETIKFVRDLSVECCNSNHDIRYVSYYKHELRRKETGHKNPIYLSEHKMSVYKLLSESDLMWLTYLPFVISVGERTKVIHAGCEPSKSFAEQDPQQLIRVRYVDDKGNAVRLPKDKLQPKDTHFWAERWEEPYDIVFGHNVWPDGKPKVFDNKRNVCVGLDGGAVFGGVLNAYFVERKQFVSVKARKAYWKR